MKPCLLSSSVYVLPVVCSYIEYSVIFNLDISRVFGSVNNNGTVVTIVVCTTDSFLVWNKTQRYLNNTTMNKVNKTHLHVFMVVTWMSACIDNMDGKKF